MKVAIIPARGGSKRIPRKNIRHFLGRPIIGYSISAARACGLFDRIVVSTDDDEIAATARAEGAETPFLRDAALADDYTGTLPVVADAIRRLRAAGAAPEFVCCIYATAPFISPDDLRRGFEVLCAGDSKYVVSVTSFPHPVQRALRMIPGGGLRPFDPAAIARRSQDLEPGYHDAAQFYWGQATAYEGGAPLLGPETRGLLLPRHRVQDIDTPEDWYRAELAYRVLQAMGEPAAR